MLDEINNELLVDVFTKYKGTEKHGKEQAKEQEKRPDNPFNIKLKSLNGLYNLDGLLVKC